jgi:hypothetical protein
MVHLKRKMTLLAHHQCTSGSKTTTPHENRAVKNVEKDGSDAEVQGFSEAPKTAAMRVHDPKRGSSALVFPRFAIPIGRNKLLYG